MTRSLEDGLGDGLSDGSTVGAPGSLGPAAAAGDEQGESSEGSCSTSAHGQSPESSTGVRHRR